MFVEALRRLAHLFRRSRFDRELDAELAFHIDARADELIQAGMAPEAAQASARRDFGSFVRAREGTRDAWRILWLEDCAADIRYAFRSFCRSPAFSLTAVLSLALGIGGASATFAVLDSVLWKALPVSDPQRLVRLSATRATDETDMLPLALVEQLRRAEIFADLAVASDDGLSFTYDDRSERLVGQAVSSNYFSFLGITPVLGRDFSSDVRAGRWAAEVIISYRFWQRRFGGDPTVIGRTVRLNTYPFTIVGVSPDSFFDTTRGRDHELRIPLLPDGQSLAQINLLDGSGARRMFVLGRLRASMTAAQSEAAANTQLTEWLRSASSAQRVYRTARVRPAASGWPGGLEVFRLPLFVLFGLVLVVLLIACANVASLLIARAVARQREIAVRASIGAGRGRLVRQLLTENLMLSCFGGLLGVALAYWAVGAFEWFLPQGHIRFVIDVRPDQRVLAFAFALSVVTGLTFGIAPAIQGARMAASAALKSDSTGSIGGAGHLRLSEALVVVQVAFSILLLIVTGLFVRTLDDLRPRDFRVAPDRVLLFTIKPQLEIYSPDRIRRLVADIVERVSALPGVQSVAAAENGPLGSRTSRQRLDLHGAANIQISTDMATPHFFETIGVPRIAGRDFAASDSLTTAPVAIVNQTLARMFFNGVNPIGQRVALRNDPQRRQFEIVGVVADTHYYDVHGMAAPAMWGALFQNTAYMPTLHVRSASADTAAVTAAVRRELDRIDTGFPVFNIRSLEQRMEDSLASERMVANTSAAIGGIALLLAGVGLYGILAYAVSRRTREIGVRVALGATGPTVVWLVAREALVLVSSGTAAGVLIGAVARRLLSAQLPGLSAVEPITLAASIAAMLTIAAIAVTVPAYRASRVEPTLALRSD